MSTEGLQIPVNIELVNTGKTNSFIPYRENFVEFISANDSVVITSNRI